MTLITRRRLLVGSGAAIAIPAIFSLPAIAQDIYPSKAVRIIAPVPAGNGSDVATRLLAKELRLR